MTKLVLDPNTIKLLFRPTRFFPRASKRLIKISALTGIVVVSLIWSPTHVSYISSACSCGGGGGGGDGGGDSSGGGGDDNSQPGGASTPLGDSTTAPVGFTKLKLIPWLSGDWPRTGSQENQTRSVISRVGSIENLLPNRGRPGETWSSLTAPRWRDTAAIKWHQKPLLFKNKGPSASQSDSGGQTSVTGSQPRSTPQNTALGTTPSLLRAPGAPRKPAPSLAEIEKMQARALNVLMRDRGILDAQAALQHAAFLGHIKTGLEYTQAAAEHTFTVAAIMSGAGGVLVSGLKAATSVSHGYKRYSELKLTGQSTKAAMASAYTLVAGEFAVDLAGSGAGKALGKAGKKAVSKLAVRDMAKNSMLGKKALTQAGKPVKAAIKRMNLEIGTLTSLVGTKLNNAWSSSSLTGGDS